MPILEANVLDGVGHVEAAGAFSKVPRDVDSGELGAGPISRDGV